MNLYRVGALALTSLALATITACGTGDDSNARTGDSPKTPAASAAGATTGIPSAQDGAASAGVLTLASDPELGPVVTDSAGFTLYRFTQDKHTPPQSACTGECARLWPPVPADGASLPPGLDTKLLGSLERPDGTEQLTVAGLPVYRYAKDTKPGQVNGEGVDGKWFASLPEEGPPAFEEALTDLVVPSAMASDLIRGR
ncbi:hypothetical protein ABTZ58_23655 [Streptomyces sp. NPDC094143]|uniref:hypothetical protein n=1 Tax=Streptomyces sp. NPDC094143 TaxID=3155310 RepID=UPI0033221C1B